MLFKLSTLALVALLGSQAHAQLTAADVVKDIENIDEVYDEVIDYLASHGPDSVDFNSRMNGFSDRLINGYTDAIADSENVHFSVSDQASIAEAMSELDRAEFLFKLMLDAKNAISENPSAELIAELKNTF